MNDWVDIGVYGDDDESGLIYLNRVKFTENNFQLTFKTDYLPVKAAIDPRRMLIERVITDNVKPVIKK